MANRSHFAAMEELEDADPGSSARVGWLNRLVGTQVSDGTLRGFAVGGGVVPHALAGPEVALSASDVDDAPSRGRPTRQDADVARAWRRRWPAMGGDAQHLGAMATFAPAVATTSHRARVPGGDLGSALSTASQVIRGDVGVEVITVDHGNWDMHADIGTVNGGRMATNATRWPRRWQPSSRISATPGSASPSSR